MLPEALENLLHERDIIQLLSIILLKQMYKLVRIPHMCFAKYGLLTYLPLQQRARKSHCCEFVLLHVILLLMYMYTSIPDVLDCLVFRHKFLLNMR